MTNSDHLQRRGAETPQAASIPNFSSDPFPSLSLSFFPSHDPIRTAPTWKSHPACCLLALPWRCTSRSEGHAAWTSSPSSCIWAAMPATMAAGSTAAAVRSRPGRPSCGFRGQSPWPSSIRAGRGREREREREEVAGKGRSSSSVCSRARQELMDELRVEKKKGSNSTSPHPPDSIPFESSHHPSLVRPHDRNCR